MAKGVFASSPALFLAPLYPWSATTGSYRAKNWLDWWSGGRRRTSHAITSTTTTNSARFAEWRVSVGTRAVGPNWLFAVIQRAVVNPYPKEPAQALKLRLRRIRFATPELAVEESHEWWNLIATAGLGGRAWNGAWNRLFSELNEIRIFAPSDMAELRADQLHIVSGREEPSRLLGHLWRAVGASGGAKDFSERSGLPAYTCRGWDAFQLAGAAAPDSARNSVFGRSFSARAEELGLSMDECGAMGPRAKLRRVAESSR